MTASPAGIFSRLWRARWLIPVAACLSVLCARAAIQFDVFLGYDSIVCPAAWTPVEFEINNDGPGFNGVVELSPSGGGGVRRMRVELPTNTKKKLLIPLFTPSGGFMSWDARLLDEKGKVRAEQTGLRPRKTLVNETLLLGAVSRTATGTPIIAATAAKDADRQPASARFLPALLPDNPLVLEGLDVFYLNSERAADLQDSQVQALISWVHAGGHLVVAIEQPGDLAASAWLKSLCPVELRGVKTIARHPDFQRWLEKPDWSTNLNLNRFEPQNARISSGEPDKVITVLPTPPPTSDDYSFEVNEMQVVDCRPRKEHVLVAAEDTPLILTSSVGNGQVTTLLFSPEREPFRSWQNLGLFWAKIAGVPSALYSNTGARVGGNGWSSDLLFAAMTGTNQIHKLPIEWLFLMLLAYLVVIGPLDQYWLKRIGKPMLTWITFPCYVICFSGLIYFVGYKLRAGESECNELHLVDVLNNGEEALLRGRTYESIYSPANETFRLESPQKIAALRSEFAAANNMGNLGTEKLDLQQEGDGFRAQVFVPVWTSQLLVSDWWNPSPLPIKSSLKTAFDGWDLSVENKTDKRLQDVRLAIEGQIIALPEIAANSSRTVHLKREEGVGLDRFVSAHREEFRAAREAQRSVFGRNTTERIGNIGEASIAACFLSKIQGGDNDASDRYVCPPGLDLSETLSRGTAVLFAYAEDYSPAESMNKFKSKRTHKNTLWRVCLSPEGS